MQSQRTKQSIKKRYRGIYPQPRVGSWNWAAHPGLVLISGLLPGLDWEGLLGGEQTRPNHSSEGSRLKVTHVVLRVPSLVEGSEDPSHTQLPPLSFAASFISYQMSVSIHGMPGTL